MHGPGYASYDGERGSKRRGTLPRLFRLHEAEATMTIVGTLLPSTSGSTNVYFWQKATFAQSTIPQSEIFWGDVDVPFARHRYPDQLLPI
jgi:hypothetical protein